MHMALDKPGHHQRAAGINDGFGARVKAAHPGDAPFPNEHGAVFHHFTSGGGPYPAVSYQDVAFRALHTSTIVWNGGKKRGFSCEPLCDSLSSNPP